MIRRIAAVTALVLAPLATVAMPAGAASCAGGTYPVSSWACGQVKHYGGWDQVWVYPRQGQCIGIEALYPGGGGDLIGEVCGGLGDVWFDTSWDGGRQGVRLFNSNGRWVTMEWPS
jgi:NADPH-dependent 2,4-dienoyl-CoA reductase/sulfur reductase-like enzyme